MKFRKKPVVIEAIQWTGDNGAEMQEFTRGVSGPYLEAGRPNTKMIISTLEGHMVADKGDYIIKGIVGEFYPVKEDIFEATYDRVEENPGGISPG